MQYLIVTQKGWWGKAKTPLEAAKNASIGGVYVEGYMLRIPEAIAEKLYCTDMGGWSYHYTDPLMKLCPDTGENQWLLEAIQEMAVFERCGFVIIKKQLRLTFIED